MAGRLVSELSLFFKKALYEVKASRFQLPAVTYYYKVLDLGCCGSPRSASDYCKISRFHFFFQEKPISAKVKFKTLGLQLY